MTWHDLHPIQLGYVAVSRVGPEFPLRHVVPPQSRWRSTWVCVHRCLIMEAIAAWSAGTPAVLMRGIMPVFRSTRDRVARAS